jgi:hypothetical protein
MNKDRPPLAERIKQGLKDGIEAARGERDDLVETWIDLEAADEGIRKSVHKARRRAPHSSPAPKP